MKHLHLPHLLSALLLAVLLAGGCEREHSKPTASSDNVLKKVNFFHYFSGSLSGGIDEMVATVNSKSTDYTVLASGLDHEAFKTMIPTSLDRGNPPELFSYWAGERVRKLVGQTQLLQIDDLWQQEELSTSFTPAIIDSAVTYNGHKYLLPITQHIVVFFYNTKIFRDLGLVPPATWQEFLTLCQRLQQQDITPIALGSRERWPAQFWFDYLLLRTAGPDFRHALMQAHHPYTHPLVVQAFKIWAELLQQGYFNQDASSLDWGEATSLVRQGKAAMTLMGTWATQRLEEPPEGLVPGEGYDFFPFPVIQPGLPKVAVGPIDGIVISRDAENRDFAKKVLSYFASTGAQQLMSSGSGALAPSTKVPATFYSPFKQRLKQEIDTSDQWAFNFDLATAAAIAERGLDSFDELVAFPVQYQQILHDLQAGIEQASGKE